MIISKNMNDSKKAPFRKIIKIRIQQTLSKITSSVQITRRDNRVRTITFAESD